MLLVMLLVSASRCRGPVYHLWNKYQWVEKHCSTTSLQHKQIVLFNSTHLHFNHHNSGRPSSLQLNIIAQKIYLWPNPTRVSQQRNICSYLPNRILAVLLATRAGKSAGEAEVVSTAVGWRCGSGGSQQNLLPFPIATPFSDMHWNNQYCRPKEYFITGLTKV